MIMALGSTPPLPVHICDVLFLGSGLEVRRIDAQPVVAQVHHNDVSGQVSVHQLIDGAVRVHVPASERGFTVSPAGRCAEPRPARIWTARLVAFFKQGFKGVALGSVIARTRTIFAGVSRGAVISRPARCADKLRPLFTAMTRQSHRSPITGLPAVALDLLIIRIARVKDLATMSARSGESLIGHFITSLGRSISERVGRGTEIPLVTPMISQRQAPLNVSPIIPNSPDLMGELAHQW